jgi:hypothetical protein
MYSPVCLFSFKVQSDYFTRLPTDSNSLVITDSVLGAFVLPSVQPWDLFVVTDASNYI